MSQAQSQSQGAAKPHRFTPYDHLISPDKLGTAGEEVGWDGKSFLLE